MELTQAEQFVTIVAFTGDEFRRFVEIFLTVVEGLETTLLRPATPPGGTNV